MVTPHAQPASWLTFTLAYLGAALRSGSGDSQAVLFGIVGLAMFGAALYNANRQPANTAEREANAPWTVFAIYALLGAGITSSGRHLFGTQFALESHYEAIALFLPLGTIGLIASSWLRTSLRDRRAWSIVLCAVLLLTLGPDIHGARYLREYSNQRKAEIVALRTGEPSVKILAYPDIHELETMLDEMQRVHDGPFAR